jgi:hypothetical protein
MPDESTSELIAHDRIAARASSVTESSGETVDEGNLCRFAYEASAVEYAVIGKRVN